MSNVVRNELNQIAVVISPFEQWFGWLRNLSLCTDPVIVKFVMERNFKGAYDYVKEHHSIQNYMFEGKVRSYSLAAQNCVPSLKIVWVDSNHKFQIYSVSTGERIVRFDESKWMSVE